MTTAEGARRARDRHDDERKGARRTPTHTALRTATAGRTSPSRSPSVAHSSGPKYSLYGPVVLKYISSSSSVTAAISSSISSLNHFPGSPSYADALKHPVVIERTLLASAGGQWNLASVSTRFRRE